MYNYISSDETKKHLLYLLNYDIAIMIHSYCHFIPKNKEELYYRRIFDSIFPDRENIVPRWIPKTEWDGVGYDPSGRAQQVHIETI